ncbi:MAG: hypothetical protein Q8M57_09770, partial [Nitrosomonas sp.]|uniref:hypothetical protein n=1 Tax=Nitrosomonas sp. TaxID=42353 RepID=UPI002735DA0E
LCHHRRRDIQRIYNVFVSRALCSLEQNASTCLAAYGALAFLHYGLQDLSFIIAQIYFARIQWQA